MCMTRRIKSELRGHACDGKSDTMSIVPAPERSSRVASPFLFVCAWMLWTGFRTSGLHQENAKSRGVIHQVSHWVTTYGIGEMEGVLWQGAAWCGACNKRSQIGSSLNLVSSFSPSTKVRFKLCINKSHACFSAKEVLFNSEVLKVDQLVTQRLQSAQWS